MTLRRRGGHPTIAAAGLLMAALALISLTSPARGTEVSPAGGEAYVEVGRRALARGDHEEARRALERAREAGVVSAEADALLGIALARLGDHARAAVLLEAAVAQRAGGLAAKRELGLSLYRLARLEEATRRLTEVIAEGDGDQATAYYLGMAHHRLGRHEYAFDVFEGALGLQGSLEPAVRFMAALAAFHLGRYGDARAGFAAVATSEGATDLGVAASRMADRARELGRRWDAVVMLEVEYDSNVLQAPESSGQIPIAGPQSDGAMRLLATLGWRPAPLDGLTLRYTGFLRELFTLDTQSLVGTYLSVDWALPRAEHAVEFGYQLQHFLLDYSHYLLAHQVTAGYALRRPSMHLALLYRARFKDFTTRFDAFDGFEHGPEAVGRWRLGPVALEAGYRLVHEDTTGTGFAPDGSEFSYLGHRPWLRVDLALGATVVLRAMSALEWRGYFNTNTFALRDGTRGPRDDLRFEGELGVTWLALPRFSVRASVRYLTSDSNVEIFDFDKVTVRGGIGYAF